MKKIYIAIAVIVITLITTSFIIFTNLNPVSFSSDEEIFSIKTNYTYNINSDKRIEILLYSNNPKSYLKVYEDVNATFTNEDSTKVIAALIEEVKLVSVHEYYDQTVYGYKIYVTPENFNSSFLINDCYIQTVDFRCSIGSLSIVNIEEKDSYLDYTKIYAIGNDHFGFKTISALVITFYNSSSTTMYIEEVDLGPFNYASLANAQEPPKDISYSTPLEDVIGEYHPTQFSEQRASLEVPAGKSATYLIPIYYYDIAFLGNTLIHINNEIYIDNFSYILNYENLEIYEEIINYAALYNVE